MSLKEQILGANDLASEKVTVTEWGCSVTIREMTAGERGAFEQSLTEGKKTTMKDVRAKLCVRCIYDDDGKLVFTDDDVAALNLKSGKVVDRLFDVAQRLSGMNKETVEDIAKNSGSGPIAA